MENVVKPRASAMKKLFESDDEDNVRDGLFRSENVKQLVIKDKSSTGHSLKRKSIGSLGRRSYALLSQHSRRQLSVEKNQSRLPSCESISQWGTDSGNRHGSRRSRTVDREQMSSEDNHDGFSLNRNTDRTSSTRRIWLQCDKFYLIMAVCAFSCMVLSVSAKSDVLPDDDFDSSNKKVKFEDFDTNVTPMPASGGGSGSSVDNHAAENKSTADKNSLGFLHAFIASFSVIVVSELGDKTFFIAAIMAMRHARITVFSGAISALGLMTVLSALFGYATNIIPKAITYYISTALFAIFGLKMLYDGFRMAPDEGADELEEVQATLRRRDDDNNDIENQKEANESSQGYKLPSPLRRILFTLFPRVFLQAFTMTFLAEWGDRSQLATVILAARENVPGVCIGGVLGHACCTGLAVLGGRMIAQKISVRTVTIIGGVVFLVFAITSLFFNPDSL